MKDLGGKLKKLRLDAGLTQKELGDLLHVSYQAVSKWERNLGLPDPSLFPEVARILNTTVNELFYEEEEALKLNAEAANKNQVTNDKKSAYKPVNRIFLIAAACVLVILAAFIVTSVVVINRKDGYKNDLLVASEVFAQENNLKIDADFNGETYSFIRKYFFDGRVLYLDKSGGENNYFYKNVLYKEGKSLTTLDLTEEEYLKDFTPYLKFYISKDDVKSVKKKNGDYALTLKTLDNLPIAALFGFTDKARITITLKNGKIFKVKIEEGKNVLTINYYFGYDFTLALPDYINP